MESKEQGRASERIAGIVMGFSLEQFLQELEDIINSNNMDAGEKLQDLAICVQDARNYAKECGML